MNKFKIGDRVKLLTLCLGDKDQKHDMTAFESQGTLQKLPNKSNHDYGSFIYVSDDGSEHIVEASDVELLGDK